MEYLKIGDHIVYVGGGRIHGDQALENGRKLCVGAEGLVKAIIKEKHQLKCAFGTYLVQLSVADIRLRSTPSTPTESKDELDTLPRSGNNPRFVARIRGETSSSCHGPSSSSFAPYLSPVPKPPPPRSSSAHARITTRLHQRRLLNNAVGAVSNIKQRDEAPQSMKTFRRVSLPSGTEWDPNKPHPPSFYCPISRQCMHDPVVLTDGHTYERKHIEQWLKNNNTSPVTAALLSEKSLFPNHALRNSIEEYFEQVLGGHRNAIRHTIAGLRRQGDFASDAALLQTIDSLMQCSVLMNADLCIERVLKSIMHEAKSLVGAEVASVFLVDKAKAELYSTVNSTGKELRIPLKSGIAGRVACSGKPLIIRDAYCDARFNVAVDDETGFTTRNIMCVPIKVRIHGVIGVTQLINKTSNGVLGCESCDFTTKDQQFLQLLASQAAVAILNSGAFDLVEGIDAFSLPQLPNNDGPNKENETLEAICGDAATIVKASEKTFPSKGAMSMLASSNDLILLQPLLEMATVSWQMDVLDLAELSKNRPLSTLAEHLFVKNQLVTYFGLDLQKVRKFLVEIEDGYSEDVPYHNRAHAASVVHFMHSLTFTGGLAEKIAATIGFGDDIERSRLLVGMAGLLAAVIHDYEHLGFSNDYLVKTSNPRALRYNDKHVNENHHCAAAFEVLVKPECNFLDVLPASEFSKLRSLVIDLVISTDMAGNKQIVEKFKAISTANQGEAGEYKYASFSSSDAILSMQMALKCADLGHLALDWGSHVKWVKRLEAEFFSQGDSEKKLGMEHISFLMDRDKPGVTKSQVGFFDFVVFPLFTSFVHAFPSASPMLSAVEDNCKRWREVESMA